jgi:DNA (cytosine-5)-methyltransferase 1
VRVLNLYAGIGGNRKLWTDVEVTAIELNPQIAKIYQDFFPQDKVIVADAHQYLLEHFKEYDFIWSSPPCPSHSRLRQGFSVANGAKVIYPDMKLYEEIILLKHNFEGKYIVENVASYYEPLIKPTELSRHYFWSNFFIRIIDIKKGKINLTGGWEKQDDAAQIKQLEVEYGYDLSEYDLSLANKRRYLRNCVIPELGLHILNESKREEYQDLFKTL